MAIASLELQKSVFTTLSSGEYEVYEIVSPNTPMPYIVIGEETLTHNNTQTHVRTVHNITIHTWSIGSSSAESKVMNNFVMQTLLNGFTVNGFSMDSIYLAMQTTMKETGTESTIFHGVLQFDITLTN